MIDFKDINDIHDKHYNIAWEIYRSSFPIFEQRDIDSQMKAMKDDKFNCRVYIENDIVIGILFFWQWKNYRYIEHFAISKDIRGKNYGSKILSEFCTEQYLNILEIDLPIDKVSISRLNFYERLGFLINKYDHIHPPYRLGYKGHDLKVLSYKNFLDDKEYNEFNNFLRQKVMIYSENKQSNYNNTNFGV